MVQFWDGVLIAIANGQNQDSTSGTRNGYNAVALMSLPCGETHLVTIGLTILVVHSSSAVTWDKVGGKKLIEGGTVHLSNLSDSARRYADFLITSIFQHVAKRIATGDLDPFTQFPFQEKRVKVVMFDETSRLKNTIREDEVWNKWLLYNCLLDSYRDRSLQEGSHELLYFRMGLEYHLYPGLRIKIAEVWGFEVCLLLMGAAYTLLKDSISTVIEIIQHQKILSELSTTKRRAWYVFVSHHNILSGLSRNLVQQVAKRNILGIRFSSTGIMQPMDSNIIVKLLQASKDTDEIIMTECGNPSEVALKSIKCVSYVLPRMQWRPGISFTKHSEAGQLRGRTEFASVTTSSLCYSCWETQYEEEADPVCYKKATFLNVFWITSALQFHKQPCRLLIQKYQRLDLRGAPIKPSPLSPIWDASILAIVEMMFLAWYWNVLILEHLC